MPIGMEPDGDVCGGCTTERGGELGDLVLFHGNVVRTLTKEMALLVLRCNLKMQGALCAMQEGVEIELSLVWGDRELHLLGAADTT